MIKYIYWKCNSPYIWTDVTFPHTQSDKTTGVVLTQSNNHSQICRWFEQTQACLKLLSFQYEGGKNLHKLLGVSTQP